MTHRCRHHQRRSPLQSATILFELFISEDAIAQRVAELGKEIERDYAGKTPIFIGILNGAFIFLADLVRAVQAIDVEVDFYKLSSYGNQKISSGQVRNLKLIDAVLEGRDVIVVEDIVDSGLSLSYIRSEILKLRPGSLRFCALFLKEETAQLEFAVDYIGFRIPKQFVVGYGLDIAQKKRNLRAVYKLREP
ncbi:MAG: hypoxanthine phosphoribosyltransferase [Chloroherpetonaceae bacterium]|nr:hypoxanthine phosphoribosyltransferase [Chloroherpetonaceae bacterium]